MILGWEKENKGRMNNIFKAITNIEPSHLADTNLYDFKNLKTQKKIFDIISNAN
jgi:tRNA 2-thiocytidine biosynthesis protein TtcA